MTHSTRTLLGALAIAGLGLSATAIATAAAQQRGQAAQPQAPANQPPPRFSVGATPPPITLEETINVSEGQRVDWDALKGKVVMLEFWATWCGPCIAAFPHINELQEEFKDKDVVFLSITNEPRTTVEPFLERRELKTWIGLDTDRSMHRDYGIRAIPRTILVGKDGKIAADTHPMRVTSESIRNLLEGKPAGIGEPKPAPTPSAPSTPPAGS